MATLTVIIDAGNFSTKYAYLDKKTIRCNSFPSYLHKYKPMEEVLNFQRVQYNELDYYAGEGVQHFYYGRKEQMYFGNTRKGHHQAQIRIVYALYNIFKETGNKEFNLVLTSPYEAMNSDKKYFVDNFEGEREAEIDEEIFKFKVNKILLAAEGLGAAQYAQSPNAAIVDAGSMTLNVLYLINGAISKSDSHTINGGTLLNSPMDLADTFAKTCTNITYDYPLVCTGGRATDMAVALKSLGYSDVLVPDMQEQPTYYINSVGLLLKYGQKFKELFEQ